MSSTSDRAKMNFFQLATQYYVAGRFGMVAQIGPAAANLLHHAIEMYLKGALAEHLTLPQLRNLGHSVTRAWEKFKHHFNDAALTAFDSAVSELDRFEAIRYPDSIVANGMAVHLALFRGDIVRSALDWHSTPKYELVLEDVDALVKIVFERANVNSSFFLRRLSEHSLRYLAVHNRHAAV